jgi:uncharacterized integral membrane protein
MLKWMLMIFLCLFIIIVAVENNPAFSTTVTFKIDLLFARWETMPLSLYVVTTFAFCLGVIVTGIYGIIDRFALKRQVRQLKKDIAAKEKELTSLRNLPITEETMETENNNPVVMN